MVLKDIERIKAELPELLHVVMFYDDGIVFQSSFEKEKSVNIPQVGTNLSEILKHIQKLLEIGVLEMEPYTKLIYETRKIVVMVIKLGEKSNIALFFRKGGEEPDLSSIKRYLQNIQRLIDSDQKISK